MNRFLTILLGGILFFSCKKSAPSKQENNTKDAQVEDLSMSFVDDNMQTVTDKKSNFHIFILMGQSNMSGCGELLPEDTIRIKSIYNLPTVGNLSWKIAKHPLHNIFSSNRFGLGLPFATEYLKANPDVKVGLVSLAYGGYNIAKLSKGSEVYKSFLDKITFIKKYGTVKGVLWHQGESDTFYEERTINYDQNITKLISDIRHDIGFSNLPFIVGDLAEFYGSYEGWKNQQDRFDRIKRLRDVLKSIPSKITNTAFVETSGCTSTDSEFIHFDRASLITLGKRYYSAYQKIRK